MGHILPYSHRIAIKTLLDQDWSQREIADYLNVYPSQICYELKRCPKGHYDPDQAQLDYVTKCARRGRKACLTDELRTLIRDLVTGLHWSFETIAHSLQLAFKTLYNWFEWGWLDLKSEDLPDRGVRKRRKAEKRGTFTRGAKSIDERPAEANDRQEIGHFEIDTVLSGKTKGQAIATFVDRKSRLIVIRRLAGRDSAAMTKALIELNADFQGLIKTVTSDHGKEFARFKEIEAATGISYYFAHPYSPHERGSNERLNRDLRAFIPKGCPIESISDAELTWIAKAMNMRPRKSLNWKTPLQLFWADLPKKFD